MIEIQNDAKSLAQGLSTSVIGKLTGRGLNFIVQVILAKFLGPGAFGLYSIGWSLIRIISLIGPLGLEQGVIHYGSKYWKKDNQKFSNIITSSVITSILSGLIIGLFLFFGSDLIANSIFKKPGLSYVLKIFAIAIPFITGLRVLSSLTTITNSTKYLIGTEELGQPASELLLLVIFLVLGWGLSGALWSTLISFILVFIVIIYFILRIFPEINVIHQINILDKELLAFSVPVALTSLFGSLITWADRLMVGIYQDEIQTGIYTTISLIAVFFVMVLSGIKIIMAPIIARMYFAGETEKLKEIFRIGTKWGLYLSIPFALIVLSSSTSLIKIFFGEAYLGGTLPLIILIIAQLINVSTGVLDTLLIMTGNNRTWLWVSGLGLVINILLNIVLIPTFGLIGASISTMVTILVVFTSALILAYQKTKIWPYDRRYIKCLLSTLIVGALLFIINGTNLQSEILILVVNSFISVGVFYGLLILLGLDDEDKDILLIVKTKLDSISHVRKVDKET